MYNIIKTYRGKDEVVMTDSLKNVNKRIKTLRSSGKMVAGHKVEFRIEKSNTTEKFSKKPHRYDISGDGRVRSNPKRK